MLKLYCENRQKHDANILFIYLKIVNFLLVYLQCTNNTGNILQNTIKYTLFLLGLYFEKPKKSKENIFKTGRKLTYNMRLDELE